MTTSGNGPSGTTISVFRRIVDLVGRIWASLSNAGELERPAGSGGSKQSNSDSDKGKSKSSKDVGA